MYKLNEVYLNLSLALLLLLFSSPNAYSTPHLSRLTLEDSFGTGELTLTTGAIIGVGLLGLWGEEWVGPETPSMGAPVEGSTDLRFSRWSNPQFNPSTQWLGGGPDLAGYIAPALGLGYYVGGSLIGGSSGYYGAYQHEAIAFTEGLSWSMFLTSLLKRLVGRERPYVVRAQLGEVDASMVEMSRSEQLLSFPSGHSTAIAMTTFFMAADLSDALVTGPLQGYSRFSRVILGIMMPYLGATSLSWLVMYSRIKDQRHWLSDTLTGATIGALSALFSYHMHFDSQGQPRRH